MGVSLFPARETSDDHGTQTPGWQLRLRASAYDLVPIGGWLGGVGAASGLLNLCRRNPFPRLFANPATADATNFALTVLPVAVMLSQAEAGPHGASWGKRRVGLRVADLAGKRPSIATAALRNTVKFSAWQIAHLGLLRVTGTLAHTHARLVGSALLWGSYAASAADLTPALVRTDARALHDLVAGTQVLAIG